MDYKALYSQKLVSADKAVECVKDGDWQISVGVWVHLMLWTLQWQSVCHR